MVPPQITQSSVCAPTKTTFRFFFPCASGKSSGGEGAAGEALLPAQEGAEAVIAAPANPRPLFSNILREIFSIKPKSRVRARIAVDSPVPQQDEWVQPRPLVIPGKTGVLIRVSPEDLQSKLDHATRTPRLSAFDCPKGGAVYDGAIWKPEIDLVKNVEEFGAKLDSVAFLENEVFENCKIG